MGGDPVPGIHEALRTFDGLIRELKNLHEAIPTMIFLLGIAKIEAEKQARGIRTREAEVR